MVTLFVTETAGRVSLRACRWVATATSSEYDMERLVRSKPVSTIYGGTSEIQRGITAKTLGL
jgi:alkylation response protein AidB-like acyl-CoA dehydrogenase